MSVVCYFPLFLRASFFRPLARRLDITFFPPLVFILLRKPWVDFRRRLLGW